MNIKSQTMFTGDNLPIMRGMDSESVDLVYLDPPFNSKKQWSAPIGSKAAGAAFKDAWTLSDIDKADLGIMADERPKLAKLIDAIGDVNGNADKSYLLMMAPRLIEIHRILKNTGSLYLHCDPTMSHSLKLVLDEIFKGVTGCGFRNEVIWGYRTQGVAMSWWPKKHDVLFYYVKGKKSPFYPQKQRLFYKKPFRHTKIDKLGRHYVDVYVRDVWDDDPATKALISQSKERTGYPTQKPLSLLRRIIKASSNEGDLVLDPFCGCATACVAAQDLNRNWIGIDISEKAIELVKQRFEDELSLLTYNIIHREDIPIRSDKVVKTTDIKHLLYGVQEGKCNGCFTHFDYRHFEIDHIVPKSKGGQNDDSNFQLLCGNCNRIKGDKSMGQLKATLKEKGILS